MDIFKKLTLEQDRDLSIAMNANVPARELVAMALLMGYQVAKAEVGALGDEARELVNLLKGVPGGEAPQEPVVLPPGTGTPVADASTVESTEVTEATVVVEQGQTEVVETTETADPNATLVKADPDASVETTTASEFSPQPDTQVDTRSGVNSDAPSAEGGAQ